VAYRADIEIGVKGTRYLDELQSKLTQVSKTIDQLNNKNVVVRRTIAGAASATPMGPGGAGVTSASAVAAATAVENKVKAARREETQAAIKAVRDRGMAENYISSVIERRLQAKQKELQLEQKITAETNNRAASSMKGRAGGAISSAIIGGGFPLLFGQGPAAAAGGALGGLAGGLLGGGFGFALSILGTALGDVITQSEKFNTSIAGLNASLDTTSAKTITTGEDIKQLAKDLQLTTEETVKLVEAFAQFGQGNTREALARAFGPVGGAQTFEQIAKAGVSEKDALESIYALRKVIGNDAAQQLALQLSTVGATETQAALLKVVSDRSIQISVAQASQVRFTDRLLSAWENIVSGVAYALTLATRFISKMQEGSLIKLPFLDRIEKVFSKIIGRTPEQIAAGRGADTEKRLRAELKAIRDALREETGALSTQTRLGAGYSGNAPESRAAQLKADYTALLEIGNAENLIRDLLFEGRDILAAEVELTKTLSDIERDRVKALEQANYQSEKDLINKTAAARVGFARQASEDKLREITQRRFEQELRAQEAVRNAVKPFTDLTLQQKIQTQYGQTYLRLIREGMLPAEAERIANFEKLVTEQLLAVDGQIKITELALIEAKARGASTVELEKQLKIYKDQQNAIRDRATQGPGEGKTDAERLQDAVAAARGELTTLTDPINQVIAGAKAIGDSFRDAFRGLVSGAMTGQEALAAFFKGVGDHFMDMASQMIAKLIEIWILETVLGMISGSSPGTASSAGANDLPGSITSPMPVAAEGAYWTGGFRAFADGGIVTRPTMGLIGEGGEPEYIIPASKMRSAMNRYASGARGSAVIPAGSDGGDGMATASALTGAIDVRYTVERINSVDYVTADQFQRGMQQAAAQGAAQGEQRTLRRLQSSTSTRKRLGM